MSMVKECVVREYRIFAEGMQRGIHRVLWMRHSSMVREVVQAVPSRSLSTVALIAVEERAVPRRLVDRKTARGFVIRESGESVARHWSYCGSFEHLGRRRFIFEDLHYRHHAPAEHESASDAKGTDLVIGAQKAQPIAPLRPRFPSLPPARVPVEKKRRKRAVTRRSK